MWGNFVSQKTGCEDSNEKTLQGRALLCEDHAGQASFGVNDL